MSKEFYYYIDESTGFATSYRQDSKDEADKKWNIMFQLIHGNRDVSAHEHMGHTDDTDHGHNASVVMSDCERKG